MDDIKTKGLIMWPQGRMDGGAKVMEFKGIQYLDRDSTSGKVEELHSILVESNVSGVFIFKTCSMLSCLPCL